MDTDHGPRTLAKACSDVSKIRSSIGFKDENLVFYQLEHVKKSKLLPTLSKNHICEDQ